jgi:hypothetical protein
MRSYPIAPSDRTPEGELCCRRLAAGQYELILPGVIDGQRFPSSPLQARREQQLLLCRADAKQTLPKAATEPRILVPAGTG